LNLRAFDATTAPLRGSRLSIRLAARWRRVTWNWPISTSGWSCASFSH